MWINIDHIKINLLSLDITDHIYSNLLSMDYLSFFFRLYKCKFTIYGLLSIIYLQVYYLWITINHIYTNLLSMGYNRLYKWKSIIYGLLSIM